MAFFRYKAVTPDGKVVEGTLEAVDQEAVLARLQEQGQLPIKVFSGEDAGGLLSREIRLPWQRKKVPQRDLLIFSQELSTLVKAGLTLDRSLSVLSDLTENANLSEVVRDLLREIKGGKALSEALGAHPQGFPKVYVNMVRAGEVGGALDQILTRLVDYLENVEELRSYLISAPIIGFSNLQQHVIQLSGFLPNGEQVQGEGWENVSVPNGDGQAFPFFHP